jgi:RimJ/RimL family protein N-acetyltransferase
MPGPVIETERLTLRKPRLEDADDVLAFIRDPEVMYWLGGGESDDRAEAVAAIERWLDRWEANGIGPFMVVREGRVIGRTGFLVWDNRTWKTSTYAEAGAHAETEIGWALAQEHWGHGYAAEAARALREWADRDRLISLIHPENVRSIRVAEKLGATPTDTIAVEDGYPLVVWVHPR